MASTITLKKDFAGGQGLGIDNYYVYATDHDVNYNDIEVAVNQLVNELSALQGPNAALVNDIAMLTDPLGPEGLLAEGVMGQHSYKVSIAGGATSLDVARGEAIVNGQRVSMGAGVNIINPGGGAAWHYVAMDSVGALSIEILANQQDLDIARVNWGGAAYSGTVEQVAEILIDGDEFAELHRRPETGDGTTPTFPLADYSASEGDDDNPFRYISNRILDIEKIIAGIKTGSESGTMGAVGFGGSVTAPGLITTDGSTFDTGTGFYRIAADVLGVAVSGVEVFRWSASLAQATANLRANAGIELPSDSATNGAVVFGAGQDVKFYYDGTDFHLITDLIGASDFLLDCGTDKTLELVETVWTDLRVALVAGPSGASNPPAWSQFMDDGGGSIGVYAFEFADAVLANENQLWFVAQLPHLYKQGTDLLAHLHWSPSASGAAGEFVRWGLEYTWQNVDGTFGNTTIIYVDASGASTATTSGDSSLTADKHYISKLGTISGSGKNISSMLICRVFRNSSHADDDLAAAAFAFEVDFHYEIDTMGSRQEYSK